MAALEAAFLTTRISKLVLYEPPLLERDHAAVADRIEAMVLKGEREQALSAFLQEIVRISADEVTAMRSRPSWPQLIVSVESQVRQIRALNRYRFDPKRVSSLRIPTLLLTGSDTHSPELKQAISVLREFLPNRRLVVFDGQQHNAMDTVPRQFADVITKFLLDAR